MRLKLLLEELLSYDEFIKQPNWETILYNNYVNNTHPLTKPDSTTDTLDNDNDQFNDGYNASIPEYLKRHVKYTRYGDETHKSILKHLALVIAIRTTNPANTLYNCAIRMNDSRWPEAERTISQDGAVAAMYAAYVIRGRWPEVETTIMQRPFWASWYARHVIGERWLEAEPIIARDQALFDHYLEYFHDH